jgi:tetratricopeptide (TPR) repeat protein
MALASEGRFDEVARAVAEVPVDERPGTARMAVQRTAPDRYGALLAAAVDPELATAVGDHIELPWTKAPNAQGALAARRRAVELGPDRAEHHDNLARALAADGQIDAAVAAWERAAAIAPAQPSYRLAPLRALVAADRLADARTRAGTIAETARKRDEVDALLLASSAAAIAGETDAAVTLAKEARALRPGDGRIAFAVADRLAEAGDREAAARAYAELLACGAHGRLWHRHEVAGKLVGLADDAVAAKLVGAALDVKRDCTVKPEEHASYLYDLRKQLANVAP